MKMKTNGIRVDWNRLVTKNTTQAKRIGSLWTYRPPVALDRIDPPYGDMSVFLRAGDRVRVVRLPGGPKPGTMGYYHIETIDGQFAGLVHGDSLKG
jgi:hypothetical protein